MEGKVGLVGRQEESLDENMGKTVGHEALPHPFPSHVGCLPRVQPYRGEEDERCAGLMGQGGG